MKRIPIFLLLIIISSICFSQEDYNPIIREGFNWQVYNTDFTSPCLTTGGADFFFGQDTIISDTIYKKVMGMPLVSFDEFDCGPYFIDSSLISRANFLLREEVENKRVFIKWDFTEETLLYDFGLNVGDTLFNDPSEGDYFYYGTSHVVTSIDTVYLENGEMRRNLYYSNWQNTIEGIGPINGIQYGGEFYLSGFGTILGCATENGEVLWSGMGGCSGTLSAFDMGGKNSFSLFPNPAGKEICLQLEDSGELYTYRVFDLTGKSWAEGQLVQTKSLLDISNLPTGVYLVQLLTNQGVPLMAKFVKTAY